MKGIGINRALAAAAAIASITRHMPGAAVRLMAEPLETLRETTFPVTPGVRQAPPYPRKRPGNGKRLRRPRPMRAAGRRRRAFLRRAQR